MRRTFDIRPNVLINTIIGINAGLFIFSLILSKSGLSLTMNPFRAMTPAPGVLDFLGASGRIPIDRYHAWWSLFTANWLHGSLLHILFNMLALKTVAPLVISEYGSFRTFTIYTLAGVAGFYASYLGNVPLTIGASAGLCGLIGALLFYGKSRGGIWGQQVLRQTSGWIVSLLMFGFLIPNINNWGHGGGFVAGVALAWLLGYLDMKRQTLFDVILAAALALITIALIGRAVIWALALTLF